MDGTLKQLLAELVSVSQQLDAAREQIRQLQADYTDIKARLEVKDAVPPSVR